MAYAPTVGPISIGIDSADGLKDHKSGTFYQPSCKTGNDHTVSFVSYGSEKNGDYYIIKISWGTCCGEKRYFKMARNLDDNSGISKNSVYPKV